VCRFEGSNWRPAAPERLRLKLICKGKFLDTKAAPSLQLLDSLIESAKLAGVEPDAYLLAAAAMPSAASRSRCPTSGPSHRPISARGARRGDVVKARTYFESGLAADARATILLTALRVTPTAGAVWRTLSPSVHLNLKLSVSCSCSNRLVATWLLESRATTPGVSSTPGCPRWSELRIYALGISVSWSPCVTGGEYGFPRAPRRRMVKS
jgi:hypothetical protein